MSHYFSTSAFDSRSLPFANYSSIAIAWSLTRSDCGGLAPLRQLEYKDNFKIAVTNVAERSDEFRRFELNACSDGQSQEFIKIQAVSSALETPFPSITFSVNDEIIIAVAKNVECSPEEALLFNHKNNPLTVALLHGSGSFEIANNATNIITHRLIDAQNKLSFITHRLGVAQLRVEDQL